jgi:hypothetical protein
MEEELVRLLIRLVGDASEYERTLPVKLSPASSTLTG